MDKLKCAILGATGVAGQQFIEALIGHPWLEISGLYASEKSANKKYSDAAVWHSENALDESVASMNVFDVSGIKGDLKKFDIVFSALPSEIAREVEGICAQEKPVISTASAFRYDMDVPILVPEVNANHVKLIELQKKNRNWKGFVLPGPNCTTTGLVVSLKPIFDNFGLKTLFMTSMQAQSGAGYPGVPSLDINDNVIPFISKEEEKVNKETLKILGSLNENGIKNADLKISCTCTRVPVTDGHTEIVFAETKKSCTPEEVKASFEKFNKEFSKQFSALPSAPKHAIIVKKEDNRPQPRFDRNLEGGMATIVGRIRKDDAFENGIKYVLLSHNTKKGAAKGGVFATEYLIKQKLI